MELDIWDWVEVLAVISSLLFTYLAAKERVSAWIFGIASAILTGLLCIQVKLYSEASLQIYYLWLSIVALISWKRNNVSKNKPLRISRMPSSLYFKTIVIGICLSAAMGYFWHWMGAELPYVDAFTTGFSLIAVWLMARKYLQSWIYWIVIDTVSVWLYYSRSLEGMSLLFVGYTLLAIFGFFQWRKNVVA
jgi:nicotinamide mononucleotide transporter